MGRVKRVGQSSIDIEVKRDFKDSNGEFKSDTLKVWFDNFLAEIVSEHINEGSVIGIKGRINIVGSSVDLIGERIIFLGGTN